MRPGSHPRFGPLPVSPACRPLSLPLSGLRENPHPLSRPSARLVSSAFSLCLRPAYVRACADAPLRRACVIPLSSFAPPRLRPGLHESPHPDKKTTAPTIVEAVCPTLRSPAGREMLWLRAPRRPLSGIRSRVPEPSRKNPCRSRGAGTVTCDASASRRTYGPIWELPAPGWSLCRPVPAGATCPFRVRQPPDGAH